MIELTDNEKLFVKLCYRRDLDISSGKPIEEYVKERKENIDKHVKDFKENCFRMVMDGVLGKSWVNPEEKTTLKWINIKTNPHYRAYHPFVGLDKGLNVWICFTDMEGRVMSDHIGCNVNSIEYYIPLPEMWDVEEKKENPLKWRTFQEMIPGDGEPIVVISKEGEPIIRYFCKLASDDIFDLLISRHLGVRFPTTYNRKDCELMWIKAPC